MKKCTDRSDGREILTGVLCWIVYFSIYPGRLNFSAGMSEMLETGCWEKGQLGSVAAAFYLAYGIGQYPSGLLGDRISPKWMIGAGVCGSALINALFPAAGTIMWMQGLWFLNGLFQALVWPPMVRLVTGMTSAERSVKVILFLSLSSPAGMLCTYLVNALLLGRGNWRAGFFLAGIWLAGVTVLWFLSLSWLERRRERQGGEIRKCMVRYKAERTTTGSAVMPHAAVSSGLVCLTAAAFIHGILKDGLTTWIPACLTVKFAIQPSFSVLLTMVLPVVNLCGIPAAQTVNRRFFQNEAATGAFCYLLSVGCFLCMLGGGGNSLYGTVVIFAIVTSMMTAVNTLLVSLVPLHFGKVGRVATVSGILNAVTYLGSAAASVLFGYTMEYAGWRETQLIWCVCAAAGGLCCACAAGNWKRNRENMDG